ncbi:hypothetical protein D3C87_1861730 [compost metagenome]
MILNRLAGNAVSGSRRRVDQEITLGQRFALVLQSEETGEFLVGTHGNQIATGLDPSRKQCGLGVVQWYFANQDKVETVE